VERFSMHVAATLMEEGFSVNRKTRIMHQRVRQPLAGAVINRQTNIPCPDFAVVKATLTNCIRKGRKLKTETPIPISALT
jgi:hypothetical protein